MARWHGTAKRATIEFVVIVTGVLVALGVDAWRDAGREREAEASYVARLIDDVRADSIELSGALRVGAAKESRLARLMALDEQTVASTSELSAVVADLQGSQSWGWEYPTARRVTFDELLSVGGLRLIRDVELREAISRYYWLHEDTEDRVESRRSELPRLVYSLVLLGEDPEDAEVGSQPALIRAVRSGQLRESAASELNFTRYQVGTTEYLIEEGGSLLLRLRAYGGS